MKPAIRVSNISKCFQLTSRKKPIHDLRETVSRLVRKVFRREASVVTEPFWALDDVSFDVAPGEVLGVVGRNGSGKSTLFKVLGRITEPTNGRVEIRGRLGTLLEVGTGFHPDLSGRENVFLSGAVLGMRAREIKRCFDDIVDFAEVGQFIDVPVKFYSSGMYVRLAFAVASHLRTDILLLDEVLAVGDYEFQKKCLKRMLDLRNEGRTIVFVSHSMANITNVCQRAILLDKGKLIAVGSTNEIAEQYLNSSISPNAEVVWNDPRPSSKTGEFCVHAVRVRNKGHYGAGRFELDRVKAIQVEIEYEVFQTDFPLLCGIELKDGNGSSIMVSTNHQILATNADLLGQRPKMRGRYRTICEIPASFLNDGMYFVSAIFAQPFFKQELYLDSVLAILVHDTSELRQHYLGKWNGSIRPRLDWHTEQMGAHLQGIHVA